VKSLPERLFFGMLKSPIGTVWAAVDGTKIAYISFTAPTEAAFRNEIDRVFPRRFVFSNDSVQGLLSELQEYFQGRRKAFSYRADLSGCTDFQKKVLQAAARIPYGEVRTYSWLAQQAGSPKAARAAGQVMASNPVPIIIPCHRVIGSSGGLCGFAGGLKALDLKRWLLELEAAGNLNEVTDELLVKVC
jgi:O-6-methylguanine DNA methyltransferase